MASRKVGGRREKEKWGKEKKREGRRKDADTEREENKKKYSWKASGPSVSHFLQGCPTF